MDLYRINLNLLVALNTLLHEKSVTIAAKKLFLTQAAMSNNLSRLRQLFSDELLIREKNRMVLTSVAESLQPRLHRTIEEIHYLLNNNAQFNPKQTTRVFNIGMSEFLADLILPTLLPLLQKQAPNIKINVIYQYQLTSVAPFEKEEYELGIGKIFQLTAPIKTQLLFKDAATCIMSSKHPLANKKTLSMKDYLAYPHISIRALDLQLPSVLDQILDEYDMQRNVRINIPFLSTAFNLIEHSTCLIATVLTKNTSVFKQKRCFVLKKLPFETPEMKFYQAWHQRFDNDLGHRWLRETIRKIFTEHPTRA